MILRVFLPARPILQALAYITEGLVNTKEIRMDYYITPCMNGLCIASDDGIDAEEVRRQAVAGPFPSLEAAKVVFPHECGKDLARRLRSIFGNDDRAAADCLLWLHS